MQQKVLPFILPAFLLSYYALRGGSFDIVVRQQEALAIWWFLAFAFALGLLPRRQPTQLGYATFAAFGVLAVWTAASLGWTASTERTLGEVARVLHYLGILVLVGSVVTRRNWRAAAAGVATAALLIVWLAVASRLAPDLIDASPVQGALFTDRLSYPFNYWNAVGAWSTCSLALALGWSAHARTTWVRASALAAAPACGLAIYLTYSRAAVVGAAVAFVLSFLLGQNRWVLSVHAIAAGAVTGLAIAVLRTHPELVNGTGDAGAGSVLAVLLLGVGVAAATVAVTRIARGDARWRLPRRLARAAALGVGVVALLGATVGVTTNADAVDHAWHQFSEEPALEASAADPARRLGSLGGKRYQHWSVAFDSYKSQPFGGTGAGTYEFAWNRSGDSVFVVDSHSLFMDQLAELGVTGLLLTLVCCAALVAGVLRARQTTSSPLDRGLHGTIAAALVVYLFHAGVDWMWESTAVSALALTAAASSAAGVRRRRIWRRPALRAGFAATAVVACVIQLPGLVATSEVRRSQTAFRAGNLDSARAHASNAVETNPWGTTPLVQRALLSEAAGEFDAAAVDTQRAVDREPQNWRWHLVLSRIRAERGDARGALRSLKAARALRPNSYFFILTGS